MNIITFDSLTQTILMVGGTVLAFIIAGVIITVLLRRKKTQRKPSEPQVRALPIIFSVVAAIALVTGVVAGSVHLTNINNDEKLTALLADNEVAVDADQFELLREGLPVEIGENTVALVPIDDGTSFELFVVPTTQAEPTAPDIDEITTPAGE